MYLSPVLGFYKLSLENSGFFHLVPLKTKIITRFVFYGFHILRGKMENKSFIH